MTTGPASTLGAVPAAGGCRFTVWAPRAQGLQLPIVEPHERLLEMQALDRGYYPADLEGLLPGALYTYRMQDGRERADPPSRLQPQGVHGSSQVADPAFSWEDGAWHGLSVSKYIIYEIHTGTFTPEGTFDAVLPHLDYLSELGVTALELMPVAQFPGGRNWG
jgi:maltooligosyltrehalose trehalohydrolase